MTGILYFYLFYRKLYPENGENLLKIWEKDLKTVKNIRTIGEQQQKNNKKNTRRRQNEKTKNKIQIKPISIPFTRARKKKKKEKEVVSDKNFLKGKKR